MTQDPANSKDLVDAVDVLCAARDLNAAALMAARSLQGEERSAMTRLMEVIDERLSAVDGALAALLKDPTV